MLNTSILSSLATVARFALLATLLCFVYPNPTRSAEQCQALLQTKCGTCHFINYICPRMDQNKGTVYWHKTINDMVKEGAVLSDEERSVLVRCLTSRDAQARSFCTGKK